MADSKLNLFTMMELGDRKIDKIQKKVILLAGNVKAGKSCVFNWAVGNQMVGAETTKGVKYVNAHMEDRSAAQIGQDTTPTTLVPNSFNIDEETTFLDMAGYNKANKYNEVIGAAYFLKTVFEKAEEFKFLIVIGEETFFDTTGKSLVQTFQGFLGMFSLAALTAEIKERLFSSISVVITRAKQPQKHVAFLDLILKRIKDPKFKVQNRELMMELVGYMIRDNRVGAFELARVNSDAGRCNILNRFNEAGWQFIKLKQTKQQIKQSITNISLRYEFNLLPNQEKQVFYKIIRQKIKSFLGFPHILKTLKYSLSQKWKKIFGSMSSETVSRNCMNQIFCFDDFFSQIQAYLRQNDKYVMQLQEQKVFTRSYNPNFMQAINCVLNIHTITYRMEKPFFYIKKQFQVKYTQFCSQLVDNFKPFCINAFQQQMMRRLKLILEKGFHQFSYLYQVCPQTICEVNENMLVYCQSFVLMQSDCKYLQTFLTYSPKNISALFTIQQIQRYQQLIYYYKNDPNIYGNFIITNFKLNQLVISTKIAKAGIYIKAGADIEACKMFIAVLRIIQAQCSLVGQPQQYNIQQRLNDLYLMKLRVVEKLVNILATLNNKKYPTAKQLAISISKHCNEIEIACQLYDSLLLESGDKDKLSSIYQQYADYCIKWGRYPQAKVLLQKKLRLQKYNYTERIYTINQIYNLVAEKSRMVDVQTENIRGLQDRLPERDEELEYILGQIEIMLDEAPESRINDSYQEEDQKKPTKKDETVFVQQYKRMYLDEEEETHRPLIDKIEHIKLQLALPDYEHFFNSSRAALKQSLEQQISSLTKYEQSLKLSSLRQTGQFNEFDKQKFVQTFGKPYLSLFYRTAKVKIRTVKELVFMHSQDTNGEAIDQLENRVSEGVDELQRLIEQLEDSFIRAWKNSDFDRPDK